MQEIIKQEKPQSQSLNGTANSLTEVLTNKEPNFLSLKNEGSDLIIKRLIAAEIAAFIIPSFPTTDADLVSKEFAKEIFERHDWKLSDIKLLIKYIQANAAQPDFQVLGNSIGLQTLLKFVSFYEEEKSAAREAHHQQLKPAEPNEVIPMPEEISKDIDELINKVKRENILEFIKRIKSRHRSGTLEWLDPVENEEHFYAFKETITGLTSEEKEKWRTSIYNAQTIDEKPAERREQLLNLLK